MSNAPRPRAHPSLLGRVAAFVLLTVIAAITAACSGSATSAPPTASPPVGGSPTPVAPGDLTGTSWRGIKINDVDPIADAPPTIQFDAGQAGGTTGCNTYGGAYTLGDDGSFSIASMVMTEMACDDARGNQEATVIEILSAADRLEFLADGTMKISGPAGSITFAEAEG